MRRLRLFSNSSSKSAASTHTGTSSSGNMPSSKSPSVKQQVAKSPIRRSRLGKDSSGTTASGNASSGSKPSGTSQQSKGRKTTGQSYTAGPLAFFVTLFIIAIGLIQLIGTMHSYALNVAQLNALRKQEAQLIEQKTDLEEEIARWQDPAYVTAKARERLGFVFSGESAIRVLHPEAVTGSQRDDANSTTNVETTGSSLPWYAEMLYSINQADEAHLASQPEETTGQEPSAEESGEAVPESQAEQELESSQGEQSTQTDAQHAESHTDDDSNNAGEGDSGSESSQ